MIFLVSKATMHIFITNNFVMVATTYCNQRTII